MNRKQQRMMTVLAGVFLGLVAAIAFVEPTEQSDVEVVRERVFPGLSSADINEIQIIRPAETVTMARTEGRWALKSPREVAADDTRVQRLVDAITRVDIGPDLSVSSLSAVGLDPVAHGIVLTDSDGGTHRLEVGIAAPVGGGSYVRVDGGVHVTRRDVADAIEHSAEDLRSREVLRFSPSQVSAFTVNGASVPIEVRRDTDGWWVILGSERTRANEEAIERFLASLFELRVDEFLAHTTSLPGAPIAITLTSDGQTQALTVGRGENDRWFARSPLHTEALRITNGLGRGLPVEADGWISTMMLPIRVTTLTEVEIALGESRLVATRTEGGWDEPRLERLLQALGTISVDRTGAVPAPTAETGRITLKEGDQRQTLVTLHQQVDGGHVAAEAAGGRSFLVPNAAFSALIAALRDTPDAE
jgi:hypothetical protein